MKLHRGPGLPSDKLTVRIGYEEKIEPDEVLENKKRLRDDQVRIAIVSNTYYPELLGGSYINRSLIGLVQDALTDTNLFVVIGGHCGNSEIIPVEERCSLMLYDYYYVLIDDNLNKQGTIFLYQFTGGWAGPFYGEDLIIEVILPRDSIDKFKCRLQTICEKNSVSFEDLGSI